VRHGAGAGRELSPQCLAWGADTDRREAGFRRRRSGWRRFQPGGILLRGAVPDPPSGERPTLSGLHPIDRLLDVVEQDIVPLTAAGVVHGNKLFGAALLRKDDLSLVLAETNNETENPLWHG